MKLRIILIVLSLLAFFSASTGGYLYYVSSKKAAFKEADRNAALHAETIKNHLSSFLSENSKPVKAIAGLHDLKEALSAPNNESPAKANFLLDHFRHALDADVCYLMSQNGNTVASSNRNEPDSFVGKNYAFRPYFRQAMQGHSAIYMALGITSKKRGAYYSNPVYGASQDSPIGVAVIKASIEPLEKDFSGECDGIVSLADPHGIAFICNRKDWLYHFLWKPSPEHITQIANDRQFGKGPWNWTGLQMNDGDNAIDLSGEKYVVYRTNIDTYPGWTIIHLQSVQAISKKIAAPLIKMTGFVILAICLFIGLLVLFLYKKASYHIAKRKAAEEALQQSEETALTLLNTPDDSAFLLDTKGVILALNKTAAGTLGRTKNELIGSHAFDLFPPELTEQRKWYHNKTITSRRPVHYEDEYKGTRLDTTIYPIFDGRGKVVRVALFGRDITERKKTEKELRLAKEELSRYSKDLERQVRERTGEITSMVKNTPAVVFIKDNEYRYISVNPRYEELCGVTDKKIRGKTDYEIFPKRIADVFRLHDRKVLEELRPLQVEEQIPHADGSYTFLSVKFPLFDEHGSARAVCGISTDITEIKKAQDQLRRLSGSIMTGQEKERAAIARELHDEFGQMLTALHIDAAWMREHFKETDPLAAKRALTMCTVTDKTIDEIRSLARCLRPGALDHLGLIDALEMHTADFEKRTGIICSFKHLKVPYLHDGLATVAYRIAQEALTNVARHSSADHVMISLYAKDNLLMLSVKDNGCSIRRDFQDHTAWAYSGCRSGPI